MERSNYIEFNHFNIPYLMLCDTLTDVDNHLRSFGVDYICDVSNFLNKYSNNFLSLTKQQIITIIKRHIEVLEKFNEEYKSETLKTMLSVRKLSRRIRHATNMPSVFSEETTSKSCETLSSSLIRYVNRHVANHLLQFGYKNTALMLANKYKIKDLVEFEVHDLLVYFNESLSNKSIKPCLNWLKKNYERIGHLSNYQITFTLFQMTKFNEILTQQSTEDALSFLRNNISPYTGKNVEHILKEAVKWVLRNKKDKTVLPMLSEDYIWDYLKCLMCNLVLQYFSLDKYSTLQVLIQVGLASFKTYECGKVSCKCPCCDPHLINIIPHIAATKLNKSVIFSPTDGSIINEDSYPVLLPCGYLATLDKKAFTDMNINVTRNSGIYCPVDKKFHLSYDIVRVYF